MPDEEQESKPEGKVEGTINAVTGLAKAVPIYEDAVQPLAKQTGKALGTVGKAVNMALSPVAAMVWGYDKIQVWIEQEVSKKLENISDEDIFPPPPNVAGPAIESLRFSENIEELKDMYANLLASSMDKNTVNCVHPGFVEIIKQLTPLEARVLQDLSNFKPKPIIQLISQNNFNKSCTNVVEDFGYFDCLKGINDYTVLIKAFVNLIRLGVIYKDYSRVLHDSDEDLYKPLIYDQNIIRETKKIEDGNCVSEIRKGLISLTPLGEDFIQACVIDHREI